MKGKHLLSLALILAINLVAFGQKKEDIKPEDKAQKMTEKMAKKLELNPEQKKAVYEANLKMVKDMGKLHEEMKASKKAHLAEMETILDETQLAQLKKHHEKRMGKHKRMRKERMHHRKRAKEEKESQEDVD